MTEEIIDNPETYVDLPSEEEPVVRSFREDFIDALLTKQFLALANGDQVNVVYVTESLKNESEEALNSLPELTQDRERLNNLYLETANMLGQQPAVSFLDMPEEEIERFLISVAQSVQIRVGGDGVQIVSNKEISEAARKDTIKKFFDQNRVVEFFSQKGVSSDYRPSPEFVEIAMLSSYFVLAALRAESEGRSKLVVPPGTLFNPHVH